jgi:hypothetical protein
LRWQSQLWLVHRSVILSEAKDLAYLREMLFHSKVSRAVNALLSSKTRELA